MGNVHMEATQINYRGGSKKMSVEDAIKAAGTEITPEEKEWIDTIPELASQEIIAPEFDAEEGVYAVGDLVIYQGGLYKFTTAHETAGAWNPEEVAAVKVSDELSSLKSGLTNVTTGNFAAETGVTIVSLSFKKSVNTITFIAVLQKVMVLNENNLFGIVPKGFRPSNTIVTMAWNDTKRCFMKLQLSSSSGGLYVEATPETADAAAQNVYVYVTYIAS